MADEDAEEGLGDDGEDSAGEGGKKKGGGLLPNLLKFVVIGLAALVFIVTVAVITFNIMNKGGKSATVIPQTDSYVAVKPQYAMFTLIGDVTTRTKDPTPYSVSVKLIIGYDLNDNASATELTQRQYELRDFVRRYFNSKTAEELKPENEARIKNEIKELLNTTVLEKARARQILFDSMSLYEMQ
ncbi:MAG: flagellar basal body-associated FliL family protein [Termitinemataceae bacterium]|nr:MAG: flagellar basal body-associated FliL family protein [Termitinemataceae bacterium]